MTEQTFEYSGVKVEVDANGIFRATVYGKHLVAPSLKAMKKRIDNNAPPFEPFQAYVRETSDRTVTIVGTMTRRHMGRKAKVWVTDRGGHLVMIYRATPKNEEIRKKILALDDERNRLERIYEENRRALVDQMKEERPDDIG